MHGVRLLGAGQRITEQTFGRRTWRESPELAAGQFAVMPVMRQLHEILWYLVEAATLPATAALHPAVDQARAATERLAGADAASLRALDVGAHRAQVGALLQRVSEVVRTPAARGEPAGCLPRRRGPARRRPGTGGPPGRRSARGRRPQCRPVGLPVPHPAAARGRAGRRRDGAAAGAAAPRPLAAGLGCREPVLDVGARQVGEPGPTAQDHLAGAVGVQLQPGQLPAAHVGLKAQHGRRRGPGRARRDPQRRELVLASRLHRHDCACPSPDGHPLVPWVTPDAAPERRPGGRMGTTRPHSPRRTT